MRGQQGAGGTTAAAAGSATGRMRSDLPSHSLASPQRQVVTNARGQQRIIGDPFAAAAALSAMDSRPVDQLNSYGHSMGVSGHTSGALQSRQQQSALSSQAAAHQLLDALQRFGPAPGAKAMLDAERSAAAHAQQAGVYVSWRSSHGATDCARVGPSSLCFCGHDYALHGGPGAAGWKKNKHACDHPQCGCANFSFIPRRPEEVGEWWLVRRKDFDVRTYKCKCKCGHAHTEHDPKGSTHRCVACSCRAWTSAFLCLICERHSEEHSTVWETHAERVADGRPVGEEYMPFAEAPEIGKLVFDRPKGSVQPRPGEGARKERRTGTTDGGAGGRRALPAAAAVTSSSRNASTPGAPFALHPPPSAVRAPPARSAAAARLPSASASVAARATVQSTAGSRTHFRQPDPFERAHEWDERPSYSGVELGDEAVSLRYSPARPASQVGTSRRHAHSSAATTSSLSHGRTSAGTSRPASTAGAIPVPASSSSSAVSARASRLALEAELAAQARQSSAGFKAVFD